MLPAYQRHLMAIVAAVAMGLVGCDQQQPIAQQPRPDPAEKPGETPPVKRKEGPQRHHDGSVPIPPATAPTTPGELNSPGAPVVPLFPAPTPTP